MLNWILEASFDFIEWFVIDKRLHYSNEDKKFNQIMENERETLKLKGGTSTWGIDSEIIISILQDHNSYKGFRFFRIVQIMKNSNGSDNLCLSGFELYGKAFGSNWIF